MTTLSIVTPMYNEAEAVDHFVARLRPVLDALDMTYEVIAVDDGSKDATVAKLMAIRAHWPQLRIVKLRRNVGHQVALAAGLHASRYDYVISIDADLQDPPETIVDMIALAQSQNLDVVYGVRSDRTSDTAFKRITAGLYYRIARRMVGDWITDQGGDFRLLSRDVVNVLVQLPDRRPVYRLLVPSLGFTHGTVPYIREKRVAGETKYPLSKMIRLSIDSITSFSAAPLRFATWLGLFSFVACLALMGFGLIAYLNNVVVPGWTSLYIAVLLLGGVQLMCLGLLGEYIGRLYDASQHRPPFLVAFDTVDLTDSRADGRDKSAHPTTLVGLSS